MTIRRPSAAAPAPWWAWALPSVVLAWLFVWPLAAVVREGITRGGDVWAVLAAPATRSAAWFTLWQAAVTTVVTVLLGLPAAWAVSRTRVVGSRLFGALTIVPFVLPTVVVGIAFVSIFGSRSPFGVDLRGTATLVVIAHVFYNLTVVVRIVGTRWAAIGSDAADAARTLGASRFDVFWRVTLPALRSAIVAAASLIFLLAFTSFGTVLILGELRVRTIEVEIWRLVHHRLDLAGAATLAILQLVVVAVVLAWNARAGRGIPTSDRRRTPSTPAVRLAASGILAVATIGLLIPLVGLVVDSFRGSRGFTLTWYRRLLVDPAPGFDLLEATGRSLWYATLATLVALVIGGCASLVVTRGGRAGRRFDTFVMLPLGTSAVTIGLGFLLAMRWPIDLRSSWVIVPLAHALVATPFVVRSVAPALDAIHPELHEAAATLGAAPGRLLRVVDWAIARRALFVGGGFAFALSLGEFGATSFIGRPSEPTLPLLVFRALGRPGSGATAAAVATVLMVVTVIGVLAVDRFRTGREQV